MIQHSLDEMRDGNFDVLEKITHNISAKHYHFLGVDYGIVGNQRMLKQQQ